MIQGLRTVIYKVPDLEAAKAWYSRALGIEPYFAEPYYVGFQVGGFELGPTGHAAPAPAAASRPTGACRTPTRRSRGSSTVEASSTRRSRTSAEASGSRRSWTRSATCSA